MRELHTFGGNGPLVEGLVAHEVPFLIVGGLAVHFHAEERQYDDLDLLLSHSPDTAGRVDAVLAGIGGAQRFNPKDFAATPSVRIPLKLGGGLYADILARADLTFDAHWELGAPVRLCNRPARVASIETLLFLLDGSTEPKHRADADLLRRTRDGAASKTTPARNDSSE